MPIRKNLPAAGSDLGKMQALTGAKAMAMVALDVMGEKY